MYGRDDLDQNREHIPRATTSLEYNTNLLGDHPVNRIQELASTVSLTAGQIQVFNEIRKQIIEQKAYNAFDLTGANIYKDIAVDACLHGQLTLLDIILTNVIAS